MVGAEESVAGVEGNGVVWVVSGVDVEENEAVLEGSGALLEVIEVLLEENVAFPCLLAEPEVGFLSFQPLVGGAETLL